MPVMNQSGPVINVQVPVPTPVTTTRQPQPATPKPRKPKRPASIPQEGQPEQAQQQVVQPQPSPRAIILPWAPNVGNQRQMKRLPKRVIKMAQGDRIRDRNQNEEAAFHRAIHDPGNNNGTDISTPALVYADWLGDHDKDAHGEVIRQHIASGLKEAIHTSEPKGKHPRGTTFIRFYRGTGTPTEIHLTHKSMSNRGAFTWVTKGQYMDMLHLAGRLMKEGAVPNNIEATKLIVPQSGA